MTATEALHALHRSLTDYAQRPNANQNYLAQQRERIAAIEAELQALQQVSLQQSIQLQDAYQQGISDEQRRQARRATSTTHNIDLYGHEGWRSLWNGQCQDAQPELYQPWTNDNKTTTYKMLPDGSITPIQ